MKRAALLLAALLAVPVLGSSPAEAAACVPWRMEDHPVIGGQLVDTYLRGERCGRLTWVDVLLSGSWDGPYRVTAVAVYRYAGAAPSSGAVRSAVVPVDARPGRTHLVRVLRGVPHRDFGWDGFVRVTLTAGGESRTVAIRF